MNGKRKGSAGENEMCALFREHGYHACRNDQRYIGGKGNPDISVDGFENVHFEVKRVERLNIHEAMRQACHDADGKIPIVLHRRNREEWLVTVPFEIWLNRWRRE